LLLYPKQLEQLGIWQGDVSLPQKGLNLIIMKLEKSWYSALQQEIEKPYIAELKKFLQKEKEQGEIIYPLEPLIFNAFLQTPIDQVEVVIIGQDPYHGPGQAHGLAFSVPDGVPAPPSLKNIFLEIERDVAVSLPSSRGCLLPWAKQGVLLLNATLTVRSKEARSHYGKGWERFTDAVVAKLLEREKPLVFLLWGRSAQEKLLSFEKIKEKGPHVFLTAAHPSPLSAYDGFVGCRHFSQTNTLLKKWGHTLIDWSL
jgi:uracil-DNA glycosylase